MANQYSGDANSICIRKVEDHLVDQLTDQLKTWAFAYARVRHEVDKGTSDSIRFEQKITGSSHRGEADRSGPDAKKAEVKIEYELEHHGDNTVGTDELEMTIRLKLTGSGQRTLKD